MNASPSPAQPIVRSGRHVRNMQHIQESLDKLQQTQQELCKERALMRQELEECLDPQSVERILRSIEKTAWKSLQTEHNFEHRPHPLQSKIPLEGGEQVYIRLKATWKHMEKKELDVAYAPTRHIHVPVEAEKSCYILPEISQGGAEGYLYISNRRFAFYEKGKSRLSIDLCQVRTRVFYQDAFQLDYEWHSQVHKDIFFLAPEDILYAETICLMNN